jgi:hypothetical protein
MSKRLLLNMVAAVVLSSCGSRDPMLSARFEPLSSSMPTIAWRARMQEGDTEFTPEAIAAAEATLTLFLQQLDAAGRDREMQREVFRVAVVTFDRLNNEHGSFVETLERDELGPWLNSAADLVGLDYEDNDVTWEWRTNW